MKDGKGIFHWLASQMSSLGLYGVEGLEMAVSENFWEVGRAGGWGGGHLILGSL